MDKQPCAPKMQSCSSEQTEPIRLQQPGERCLVMQVGGPEAPMRDTYTPAQEHTWFMSPSVQRTHTNASGARGETP